MELTTKGKKLLKEFLDITGSPSDNCYISDLVKNDDGNKLAKLYYNDCVTGANGEEYSRDLELLYAALMRMGINLLKYWPAIDLDCAFYFCCKPDLCTDPKIVIPGNIKKICTDSIQASGPLTVVIQDGVELIDGSAISGFGIINVYLPYSNILCFTDCFEEGTNVYLPYTFNDPAMPKNFKFEEDDVYCMYTFIDLSGARRRGYIAI